MLLSTLAQGAFATASDLAAERDAGDTYASGQPYFTGDEALDFYNSYFGNLPTTNPRWVGLSQWLGMTDDQQRAAIAGLTQTDITGAISITSASKVPAMPPIGVSVAPAVTPIVPLAANDPVNVSVSGVPVPVVAPVLSTGVSPISLPTPAPTILTTGIAATSAPVPTPGSATVTTATPAPKMTLTHKLLFGLLAVVIIIKVLK